MGQIVGRLVRDGLNRYDPARPRRARRKAERVQGAEALAGSGGTPAALQPDRPATAGDTSPAKSSPGRQAAAAPTGRSVEPAEETASRAVATAVHGNGSPTVATPEPAANAGGCAAGSRPSPAKRWPGRKDNSTLPSGRRAQRAPATDSHTRHPGNDTSAAKSLGNREPRVSSAVRHTRVANGAANTRSGSNRLQHANATAAKPATPSPSGGISLAESSEAPELRVAPWPGRLTANGSEDPTSVRVKPSLSSPSGCTSPAKEWGTESSSGAAAVRGNGADTSRSSDRATPDTAPPRRRKRTAIPLPVKREVWQRDGGMCSFVDPDSGRRCGSRFLLEFDHVVPYAAGGTHDAGNLRLYCGAHHRYRHMHRSAEPGVGGRRKRG